MKLIDPTSLPLFPRYQLQKQHAWLLVNMQWNHRLQRLNLQTNHHLWELSRIVGAIGLQAQIAAVDAHISLARRYREATWRLNETEHRLLWRTLGCFWQQLSYDYGARRNGRAGFHDWSEGLPIEHLGDTRGDVLVRFYWPVSDPPIFDETEFLQTRYTFARPV